MHTKTSAFLTVANLIDGKWIPADSGETLAVTYPADGTTLASDTECGLSCCFYMRGLGLQAATSGGTT